MLEIVGDIKFALCFMYTRVIHVLSMSVCLKFHVTEAKFQVCETLKIKIKFEALTSPAMTNTFNTSIKLRLLIKLVQKFPLLDGSFLQFIPTEIYQLKNFLLIYE